MMIISSVSSVISTVNKINVMLISVLPKFVFVDWEIKEIEVEYPKSPLTILKDSEGIAVNCMYS